MAKIKNKMPNFRCGIITSFLRCWNEYKIVQFWKTVQRYLLNINICVTNFTLRYITDQDSPNTSPSFCPNVRQGSSLLLDPDLHFLEDLR